jgi:hypothetical protein
VTYAFDTRPAPACQGPCSTPRLRLAGAALENINTSEAPWRLPVEAQLDYLEGVIRKLLVRSPVARMERGADYIFLSPSGDGFPISISISYGRRLLLEFGGWHEDEFPGPIMLHLVDLALSGRVQLKDEFLNDKPYGHSVLASHGKSGWVTVGANSFFVISLFRRRHTFRFRRYPAVP